MSSMPTESSASISNITMMTGRTWGLRKTHQADARLSFQTRARCSLDRSLVDYITGIFEKLPDSCLSRKLLDTGTGLPGEFQD